MFGPLKQVRALFPQDLFNINPPPQRRYSVYAEEDSTPNEEISLDRKSTPIIGIHNKIHPPTISLAPGKSLFPFRSDTLAGFDLFNRDFVFRQTVDLPLTKTPITSYLRYDMDTSALNQIMIFKGFPPSSTRQIDDFTYPDQRTTIHLKKGPEQVVRQSSYNSIDLKPEEDPILTLVSKLSARIKDTLDVFVTYDADNAKDSIRYLIPIFREAPLTLEDPILSTMQQLRRQFDRLIGPAPKYKIVDREFVLEK